MARNLTSTDEPRDRGRPRKAPTPHGDNRPPVEGYINRIAGMETEVRDLRDAIKEEYEAAKGAGWLKKAIRIVVARKLESEKARVKRVEAEDEAEQIMARLGMLRDTPLGQAAVAAAARG